MFCIIQPLLRKKPPNPGDYKRYEVSSMSVMNQDGSNKRTCWGYYPDYEAGRFERDHRECYKVSIHESRREGGRIEKKQCVITTLGYYDLADGFSLYDYIDSGIRRAAEVFGADYETLYDLVERKVQPLADELAKEFQQSEEYKARRQRKKLQEDYQKAKKAFGEKV